MRSFRVDAPTDVDGELAGLGRLGPALTWLAAAQGAWPPREPTAVARVLLSDDHAATGDVEDPVEAGAAQADELADRGTDLVVLSSAAGAVPGVVVAAAMLALEPVEAVGTSTGSASSPGGAAGWASLTVGVRDGLRRARPHLGDPLGLVDAAGSEALARATGMLAQCAVRRTPVLLDGSAVVCGAALVAERLAPGGCAWWLPGQAPPSPAAARALVELGLTPLLDLSLDLPLGAELALSVLLQAVEHVRG